jgi:hypothetical protein
MQRRDVQEWMREQLQESEQRTMDMVQRLLRAQWSKMEELHQSVRVLNRSVDQLHWSVSEGLRQEREHGERTAETTRHEVQSMLRDGLSDLNALVLTFNEQKQQVTTLCSTVQDGMREQHDTLDHLSERADRVHWRSAWTTAYLAHRSSIDTTLRGNAIPLDHESRQLLEQLRAKPPHQAAAPSCALVTFPPDSDQEAQFAYHTYYVAHAKYSRDQPLVLDHQRQVCALMGCDETRALVLSLCNDDNEEPLNDFHPHSSATQYLKDHAPHVLRFMHVLARTPAKERDKPLFAFDRSAIQAGAPLLMPFFDKYAIDPNDDGEMVFASPLAYVVRLWYQYAPPIQQRYAPEQLGTEFPWRFPHAVRDVLQLPAEEASWGTHVDVLYAQCKDSAATSKRKRTPSNTKRNKRAKRA